MTRVGLLVALCLLSVATGAGAQQPARQLLWQTNAGGDDIHVIDIETGALVRRLVVGPEPHGLAATADGRTVVVTVEANCRSQGELVWIDAGTFEITRRQPICREPHALAVTPDGRWLYLPCRDGQYWVVNGQTGEVVRRISTGGRPHNTQISNDGRLAFLSSMADAHEVFVIDIAADHQVRHRIRFGGSLRPSALAADSRMLAQQIDGLNGFQVVDVGRGSLVATVQHRTPLGGLRLPFLDHIGRLGTDGLRRCHGLAIRPDQREIWSVCADHVTVHAWAGPDFREIAAVRLPAKGYWITFAPDSDHAFVALSETGQVAMIDTRTKRIVRSLAAGDSPKRNLVLSPPR
jgi:DNA-binding beta-propeller fold protein YncE